MTTITEFAYKLEQMQTNVLTGCEHIQQIQISAADQQKHVIATVNDAFAAFNAAMEAHLVAMKALLGE